MVDNAVGFEEAERLLSKTPRVGKRVDRISHL